MRNVKTAIVFLLAAILCSCATLKQYGAPEMPVADSLFAAVGQSSIADLGWRDFFTDPALQALIEEGLANNTDLKTAALRVQQAQSSLAMARKAFLPGLNIPVAGNLAYSGDRY
ncbi:MAG: TolC family protein, partial [Bacteroidales bacterium]|nr:TolC family protein [Candidatus Equibacterium intestinale]